MTGDVWYRNPHNYVKELAEVGAPFKIVWDRGILIKKRIDPVKHAQLYFGSGAEFDILCVGAQGSVHLDQDHDLDNPVGVYPTWEFGENMDILEEMVSSPIGMDAAACSANVPTDERPVLGQPHRVVVTNLPDARLPANRAFYRTLSELQEEYASCTIMLHGSYSWRVMFGMGIASCDVEPRSEAANGRVVLPNGKTLAYARTVKQMQWVNLLNMSVVDLKEPRNRCIFNIKSARWASQYFGEDVPFKTNGAHEVDTTSPQTHLPVVSNGSHRSNFNVPKQEGDMIACDSCSLADSCKFARDGAVCSVPSSESKSVAAMFNTRDSSQIISGLGAILEKSAQRLERGLEIEEDLGVLDPEVTKMSNQLFANAAKLAKLVDPSLTKPTVQINNGGGGAIVSSSPKELASQVVAALEAQGFTREQITAEMFEAMVQKLTGTAPTAVLGSVQN